MSHLVFSIRITDRSFPVSSLIGKINPVFLEHCRDMITPAPTLVAPHSTKLDKLDVNSARSHLTNHYPYAFTDTYGKVSGAPFIYKTGPPWPKRVRGPHTHPFTRETCPIHNHPITPFWPQFLRDAEAYLDSLGVNFTVITGFSFANTGEETAFCPLLVTIGVLPNSLTFEEAKSAADYLKNTILAGVGFPEINVAVREWTTRLSSCGPRLPSLNPLVDPIAEFRHPFASTLGLYVAPLKMPHYEGTIGLYLRRSRDSDDILALTAAHVARPLPEYPMKAYLIEMAAGIARQ